jgi:hypothetical protein
MKNKSKQPRRSFVSSKRRNCLSPRLRLPRWEKCDAEHTFNRSAAPMLIAMQSVRRVVAGLEEGCISELRPRVGGWLEGGAPSRRPRRRVARRRLEAADRPQCFRSER